MCHILQREKECVKGKKQEKKTSKSKWKIKIYSYKAITERNHLHKMLLKLCGEAVTIFMVQFILVALFFFMMKMSSTFPPILAVLVIGTTPAVKSAAS